MGDETMTIDRDNNGRFKPGCKPGPGRPRREVERAYLDVIRETVPIQRWARIVAKAAEQAEAGDARSREWLGTYLCGDDPQAMIDLLDRMQELEAQQQAQEALGLWRN